MTYEDVNEGGTTTEQGIVIYDNAGTETVALTVIESHEYPPFADHAITEAGTGFAVVTRDDNFGSIYIGRYDNTGSQIGSSETVIGSGADGPMAATELDNGNIVVVYEVSGELHTHVYSASGASLYDSYTEEVELSSDSAGAVDVAALGSNNFVVTWQDGNGDIIARHFNASGTSVSSTLVTSVTQEVTVNTVTSGTQDNPSVDVHSDGSYAIAYETTGNNGILVQRFDGSGSKIGSETTIAEGGGASHDNPSLVAYDNGDFAVLYEDGGDVSMRIADASGGGSSTNTISISLLDGSTIGGPGTLRNESDIDATGTVTIASDAELENAGTFTQGVGTLDIAGTFENLTAGVISVEGGELELQSGGSFSNAGTLTLEGRDSNARLVFEEDVTNSGTIILDSQSTSITSSGEISAIVDTVTLTSSGDILVKDANEAGVTHRIDANLTNTGTMDLDASLDFQKTSA